MQLSIVSASFVLLRLIRPGCGEDDVNEETRLTAHEDSVRCQSPRRDPEDPGLSRPVVEASARFRDRAGHLPRITGKLF